MLLALFLFFYQAPGLAVSLAPPAAEEITVVSGIFVLPGHKYIPIVKKFSNPRKPSALGTSFCALGYSPPGNQTCSKASATLLRNKPLPVLLEGARVDSGSGWRPREGPLLPAVRGCRGCSGAPRAGAAQLLPPAGAGAEPGAAGSTGPAGGACAGAVGSALTAHQETGSSRSIFENTRERAAPAAVRVLPNVASVNSPGCSRTDSPARENLRSACAPGSDVLLFSQQRGQLFPTHGVRESRG